MENDALIHMYGFETVISIAPIYPNNTFQFSIKVIESLISESNSTELTIVEPDGKQSRA